MSRNIILLVIVLFWIIVTILGVKQFLKDHVTSPSIKLVLPEVTESPEASQSSQEFMVKRVVDGDTIELENGQKVRYIGINTPETVDPRRPVQCYGQEAKKENIKLVEGKKVRLEKDISETDKYQRLLRYVYVGGVFVNEYLVREGFAQISTFPPDVKFASLFKEAQQQAKENKKGLWSTCPPIK